MMRSNALCLFFAGGLLSAGYASAAVIDITAVTLSPSSGTTGVKMIVDFTAGAITYGNLVGATASDIGSGTERYWTRLTPARILLQTPAL